MSETERARWNDALHAALGVPPCKSACWHVVRDAHGEPFTALGLANVIARYAAAADGVTQPSDARTYKRIVGRKIVEEPIPPQWQGVDRNRALADALQAVVLPWKNLRDVPPEIEKARAALADWESS